MTFHFSKMVDMSYDSALERVSEVLASEGFAVLTEIDAREKFKKKLGIDFRNYKILGACDPAVAHKVLVEEDKAGLFLPCNVVVQEHDDGRVEVSAVDPEPMLSILDNPALFEMARDVRERLERVIEAL